MIEHFEQQINNSLNKSKNFYVTSLGGIIVPGEVGLMAFIRSESGTDNNLVVNNKVIRLSIDELKYYYSEHYRYISYIQALFRDIPIIDRKS